ncbi:hypothetical protein OG946_09855 [Streptomyces sp. NBC_01808]|uniref:hypothetical protein n=1 Tax=Streptomyces sp. NBC_01808 TaxID=2975947 RepID=UPI002DDA5C33|nr:hypothetical protein [Streptomyces sp. NBC_01808]WSA37664.1 hypothetical protein OG946_09855 [Streptomyces sp. NBC_01808]
MASQEPHYQNGMRVPAIAPWTGEASVAARVTRRWLPFLGGEGIGYADEQPMDRHRGLLWKRVPEAPGEGRAQIGLVHGPRQRQAMTDKLCQVCFAPAAPTGEPLLFVVAGDEPIAAGERMFQPPVHKTCGDEAVRHCPRLRRSHTAALVGRTSSWGVAGLVYNPATLQPVLSTAKSGLTLVPYGNPSRLRWVLAVQEVVTVHDCTPVTLGELTPG